MTPNGRGIGLPLAKLLVAAILVATLCLTIDLDEAAAALERARPLSLATAFAASVLGVLVSAEKWRGFLCEAGVRLSLAACTRLYWVGMFASNFLPTSVGGDAVRLLRMRAMVAATAGMLAVLLTGELYLGVAPVTPPRLLFELLEVVLLVGASIACALLVRPAAGTDQGRVRNVCI